MTTKENNPIKLFFSGTNAKKLYSYIQKGLKEQYNVQIDERHMDKMIDIMKIIIKPLPKQISADVDVDWFVKTLNEQTLKEALPIFVEIAKTSNSGSSRTAPSQQLPQPIGRMNLGGPAVRPAQSTPVISVQNDDESYTRMMQDRGLGGASAASTQLPRVPKFEDPVVEYNDDINNLYEIEEQQRQQRDMIPPPDSRVPLPFDNQQKGFQIREQPTEYFSESTPITAAAIRVEHDDEKVVVAPSRVLIPKLSRNLVADSAQIPHLFVVNSKDRNPAVYPLISEYKLELRQPYIDVVAVELVNATIPMSFYNVNASNNTIFFEETPGIILQAFVPVGNYPDSTTVAAAVAASMTAKSLADGNGVTYTESVNPLTGKIKLISNGASGSIFSLFFFGAPSMEGPGPIQYQKEKPQYPPQSIGPVIGFDTTDYTGSLMYDAPFFPSMQSVPNVYLHIRELELLECNNSSIQDAFAVLPMDDADDGGAPGYKFAHCSSEDAAPFVKYFSPPKGKLAYLTVSLRDDAGNLIDFNGINHSFVLKIITKDKTQGPYDDENDSRSSSANHSSHHH